MTSLNKIPGKLSDYPTYSDSPSEFMKNVLVVDDDEISIFLCRKMLQRTGMVNEIHTAINGEQAINFLNDYYHANHSLPDVVLLDINMPVMDGFQFLRAFKTLTIPYKEKVRVIMMSSSNTTSDILKAKELGADYYLLKPVCEEKLRAELSMVPV